MGLHLIIGNKNYSSWSLRPWLAMKVAGIAFEETLISLDAPDFKARVDGGERRRQGAGAASTAMFASGNRLRSSNFSPRNFPRRPVAGSKQARAPMRARRGRNACRLPAAAAAFADECRGGR